MIRKFLLNIALQILSSLNYQILIMQEEKSSVILCFCCEEHLKAASAQVITSPNINHLTLDPITGVNNERTYL